MLTEEIKLFKFLLKQVFFLFLTFLGFFCLYLKFNLVKNDNFYVFANNLIIAMQNKVSFFQIDKTKLLNEISSIIQSSNYFAYFALSCIFLGLVFFSLPFIMKKKETHSLFDRIKTLKQIQQRLNPTSFEEFIAYLYRKKGYKSAKRVGFGNSSENVKKSKKDGSYGDGGKDVIISRPFSRDIIIQAKFYTNPVGVSVVREMFAIMMHYKAKKVIIITTSTFSRDAIHFAKGKKIELIDGKTLERML